MNTQNEILTPGVVVLLSLIAVLIILIIYFTIVACRQRSKRPQMVKRLKQQGLRIHTFFYHEGGLPVVPGSMCGIFSYPDRIEFKAGTTEIKLPRDKITDMQLKTNTGIQNPSLSRTIRYAARYVRHGNSFSAGMAPSPKRVIVSQYLIITYTNDHRGPAYIVFDVKYNLSAANKLIKEFRELNTTSGIKVEL